MMIAKNHEPYGWIGKGTAAALKDRPGARRLKKQGASVILEA